MIDSSMLGVRGTAEILAEIVQRRFGLCANCFLKSEMNTFDIFI